MNNNNNNDFRLNDLTNLVSNKRNTNNIRDVQNNFKNNLKNTYNTGVSSFHNMKTWQKIVTIIGILIIILLVIYIGYVIYKQMHRKQYEILYMTGIEQYRPHQAQETFSYKDSTNEDKITPYIPAYLMKEQNGPIYTYSFWIYVNDWGYKYGEWKHIMHRGSDPRNINDISEISGQSPGVYLDPTLNKIVIMLQTVKDNKIIEEQIILDDIDLNKWIYVTITLNIDYVNVYKDGNLERIYNLRGKINSDKNNTYINYFGGFSGYMAYLSFTDEELTPIQIMKNYNEQKKVFQKYIRYLITKKHIEHIEHNSKNKDNDISNDISNEVSKCYNKKIQIKDTKNTIKDKMEQITSILCNSGVKEYCSYQFPEFNIDIEKDYKNLCDKLLSQKIQNNDIINLCK